MYTVLGQLRRPRTSRAANAEKQAAAAGREADEAGHEADEAGHEHKGDARESLIS